MQKDSPSTDYDDSDSDSSPPPAAVTTTAKSSSPTDKSSTPGGKKRATRRTWNHALETHIFNPHEIATLGAPHRRTIYLASLEGHTDRLHSQLHALAHYPVHPDVLSPYKGLNCKTAKGMVAGLQHDIVCARKSLNDIRKAMGELKKAYEAAREAQRSGSPNVNVNLSPMKAERETPGPVTAEHPPPPRKYSLDSSLDFSHSRLR